LPLCNIINGGKHARGSTDIQEFMVLPIGAASFAEAVRISVDIFHCLRQVLSAAGYNTNVGDEGGFAPALHNGNREAFEHLARATEQAGYKLGHEVLFACDVAASQLVTDHGYQLQTERRVLTSDELIAYYRQLSADFPLRSVEDGLGEHDWAGWQALTAALGNQLQLVG